MVSEPVLSNIEGVESILVIWECQTDVLRHPEHSRRTKLITKLKTFLTA